MDWVSAILLGLTSYLLGSVSTAYIFVYLVKGIDIRRVGTGNVGALNAFHQIGIAGGLMVLAVDAGKGALAVLAIDWVGAPDWSVYLSTPLVVAGHNWPVFLGFRGGKGAAAIFGISLAVQPLPTLITLAPVVVLIILTRNVVWSAAFGFVLLNIMLVATRQGPEQISLCAGLTAVVIGTYLLSVREHIGDSVKTRQWRELFTGLA